MMKLTPENAAAVIPLLQAVVDGKVIQYRWHDGEWRDVSAEKKVDFSDELLCYRIKPEPRVVWVNETHGAPSTWDVYAEKVEAEKYGPRVIGVSRIAVRYVEDPTNGK